MWIRTVDYLLAATGVAGHVALLLILVRRRLLLRLPAFAILIAFYLLRSVWLLAPQLTREWPASYWFLVYLDPGLQLVVMIALGLAAWRMQKSAIGPIRAVLTIVLFLIVSILVAWLIGYSSHYSPRNISLKLSMFVSALWLQAALGLATLLRTSDWQTKRLPLGITLGFAAYSAASILTEIVHMRFALSRAAALYTGLSLFRVIVYLLCLLGWFLLILRDRTNVSGSSHR